MANLYYKIAIHQPDRVAILLITGLKAAYRANTVHLLLMISHFETTRLI